MITFYEKPGCATNARQKALLRVAGHELDVRSLLAEPWTAERLRAFFGDLPPSRWFNKAAPRVKSGHVDPERLDGDTAMALLVADPLLIRRPLIQSGEWHHVGFDTIELDARLGLASDRGVTQAGAVVSNPLEDCTRVKLGGNCATDGVMTFTRGPGRPDIHQDREAHPGREPRSKT